MRSILSFLLISIFISGCNSTENKSAEEIKPDTTAIITPTPPAPVKTTLKEMQLNEKTVITGKKLYNSAKIDAETYKSLSIKLIDSTGSNEVGFKYHLVDTLFSGNNIKVLLIGREYESENYIWMAVYDSNNKLIDNKAVYYDNAEGFMSAETTIKNNQLSITTFNEYAEKEKDKKLKEVYQLNENNKIVKIP